MRSVRHGSKCGGIFADELPASEKKGRKEKQQNVQIAQQVNEIYDAIQK